MRETHPQYFPELKLGDQVQSEHFTGMVCELNKKFYIFGTKMKDSSVLHQYAISVGSLLFLVKVLKARCESLEKYFTGENIAKKISKKSN